MKNIIRRYGLLSFAICIMFMTNAQTIKPDLQNTALWTVINRSVEALTENDKKIVRFSESAGDGFMLLKEHTFSNGVIEFDVKGKNVVQQSFVGFVFHGQDEKTFDAVYFRPFNFANSDTARRRRAVQYISMPGFPWEKLREKYPGKYEAKVDPVPNPDDWFHARIVVKGKRVSVYVNHAQAPSLEVEKLTNTTVGNVGFWVGNSSGGSFSNLTITHLQ